jgi:hypothetical protein
MIDKALIYKQAAKTRNMRLHLLKIVPAVAAFAFVISLVNILSIINNNNPDSNGNGNRGRDNPGAAITSEHPFTPLPAMPAPPAAEETSGFTGTETLYRDDGSYTIFELDENGNLIKATSHDADGSISQWQENEHDENGSHIKSTGYSADGTMKWWFEFEYDENGNQIKETMYSCLDDPDGLKLWWKYFEHDERGNLIKETFYNAATGLIDWQKEYEYDENGEVINEIMHLSGPDNDLFDEIPADEPYHCYPVFERIDRLTVGDGYEPENDVNFTVSDDERSELWRLMRVDEWVVAADLPVTSFYPTFYIAEETETAFQVWLFTPAFNQWALIVPSFPNPNDDFKICYFAPLDIIADIIAFTETLNSGGS